MNQMKSNKAIVKFMGAKVSFVMSHTPIATFYDGKQYFVRNLKYHKNWEWLMKVVDKVETLTNGHCLNGTGTIPLKVDIIRQEDDSYLCRIVFNQSSKFISTSENRIDAVYESIVDFSKWYIETKNK